MLVIVSNTMRAKVHGNFTVFCVLVLIVSSVETVLSSGLPAPHKVSVSCNSYGVVLDWQSSGLSADADFLLDLVPDYGERIPLVTRSHQYNISDHLQDASFNRYLVTVKARDGAVESEAVQSEIFSYDSYATANITCDLEFPAVDLSPGDNQLIVRFINPLHLYGHTPALQNLTTRKWLIYYVTSNHKGANESKDMFYCVPNLNECESSVAFPKKQAEYCITLSGKIGLIRVRQTNPLCYRGTLKPPSKQQISQSDSAGAPSRHGEARPTESTGLLVAVYFIPVVVIVAAVFIALSVRLFLTVVIKKESLAKYPEILNKLSKPLNILKVETEPVVENPRVEPDMAVFLEHDSPESSALLWILANSKQLSDISGSFTSEENKEKDSASCDPEELNYSDTTSSFPSAYDCPHRFEMSPGDMVDGYGP